MNAEEDTMTAETPRLVLLVGSGPNAMDAIKWPKAKDVKIACVNNSFRIREDWDYLVFPGDFPIERRPQKIEDGQQLVGAAKYVKALNNCGGLVFTGSTMAYNAAYWILDELQPDIIAFIGCDMDYSQKDGVTHFYGKGTADPLRKNKTIQDLSAKSARFHVFARLRGVAVCNLSTANFSRLTFPRVTADALFRGLSCYCISPLAGPLVDDAQEIIEAEIATGYKCEDGNLPRIYGMLDADRLRIIDEAWVALEKRLPPSG